MGKKSKKLKKKYEWDMIHMEANHKNEVRRLRKDIEILINNSPFESVMEIKQRWELQKNLEVSVWQGTVPTNMDGAWRMKVREGIISNPGITDLLVDT